MSIKERFLSAQGEMGRVNFLICICSVVGFWFALENILMHAVAGVVHLVTHGQSATYASTMMRMTLFSATYAGPLYILISTYLIYCLVAKRCHDRNRGAPFVALFTVALLLPPTIEAARSTSKLLGFGPVLQGLIQEPLAVAILAVLWFWATVELVFLGRPS